MEVTALCIRLVINILMLQPCYCAEKSDLRIAPNRLQFFEYESISCDCEGFGDFTEWRVMRRIMGVETICGPDWNQSKGPCSIKHAFESDSGEYWCEAGGTGRNNSVNISVTAGSVILESPALPVMEGESVTLLCRNKTTSSVPIADFYKDGTLTRTGYTGSVTIYNVSKSDEGLYKCKITGGGESAESRLAVRAVLSPANSKTSVESGHLILSSPSTEAYQGQTPLLDSHSPRVFTPLWMVVTVVLGALLLLLMGGLYCIKQQDNDESCTTTAYYTLSMGPDVGLSPSSLCKYQPTSK